jgi:ribosome biogenesis protein BRX1
MEHSIEEEEDKEGKGEERQPTRSENKRRCLVLCSRGVTARYRHLLEDIRNLLPHHKKDAKLDVGKAGYVGRAVNEIAELKSCNSVLFLECRKRADCYMWLSETPQGPSVKFHISNVHTMDELRLTGNCMKGSRPILSFDESFGRIPHLQLLKVLLIKVFGTPKGHPKSKPFVDRVMAFYYADQKVRISEGLKFIT